MSEEKRIDLEQLRELFRLLNEFEIGEFEFREGDLRVRIVHRQAAVKNHHEAGLVAGLLNTLLQQVPQASLPAPTTAEGVNVHETSPDSKEPVAEKTVEETDEADLHIIRSPIVGTFYRAPAPDAAPFVEIGDKVKAGQTVCIVEAMKIMNEIQSDVEGEVVAIYVANGAPVEFGQKLIAIRPLGNA